MEKVLNKKYGLFTAISMVIGIVIGSGVFFKAEKIMSETQGNILTGVIAWLIGGFIMISCSCVFGMMASKYEKVNGIVDYAEVMLGKTYGYYFGWFMATIYYPTLTSVLAWVSARYFSVLVGWNITGGECMTLSMLFLISAYAINTLSPKLAGHFQVATTLIKLIPLVFMCIFGIAGGLYNGTLTQNLTFSSSLDFGHHSLFSAVVAAAFAYDGWIVATCINSELKNAKRNLPLALIFGSVFVVIIYVLYYIGLAGSMPVDKIIHAKEGSAVLVFSSIFGRVGGTLIMALITISCLGTLNGLMLGSVRGFYSVAIRKEGPKPDVLSSVDEKVGMPQNSGIFGLLLCALWLTFFYGANLSSGWFSPLNFDSSELPIVTIYAMYVPIFVMFMIKEKNVNFFKRFILPSVAVISAVFMTIAAIYSHKTTVISYLIVYAVIMAVGLLMNNSRKNNSHQIK